MKYFGLKHKKEGILGVHIVSNGDDAEFCNETSVYFSSYEQVPWLIKKKDYIEDVLKGEHVAWYNSSIEKPENSSFKIKDLEMYEVEIPD